MAREKSDIQFKSVTMRIPEELYSEYKKVLQKKGAIVTYDIRNYMNNVVEDDKKGEKWAQKRAFPAKRLLCMWLSL